MRNKVILVLLFWLAAVGTTFAEDDPVTPPNITAQPVAISISPGGEAVALSFAAEKTDCEISYQWYLSASDDNTAGTPITGATSAEYLTEPFTEKGIRYYYCVATAIDGTSATSDVAVVAHTGLPVFYVNTPGGVEITSKVDWTAGAIISSTSVGC